MVDNLLQSKIYQFSYSFCLPTSTWLQPRSFNYSPISNDGGFLSTMGGSKLMVATTRDMDYFQKKLLVSYRAFTIMELMRSLLSSTDSGRNPAESGQFPEFQRNQFWQRGLPNWFNDSDGILNGIQIPPEWFLESHRRNQFPEFNETESGSSTTTSVFKSS